MQPHTATLSVRNALLFNALALLRGGLVVFLPFFWFFRILIAAGLLADRASASLRVSHDAPARRPLEMALTRPRRCRSWCARSTRNTATPFFEALFTFVRGGGYKQQSSRALSVYAGQSLERVHLIHLINISETLNSQKMCTQNNALAWPISTPLRSLTLKRIPVTSRTFTSGSSLFRLPCRLNYFRWLAAVAGRPPERPRARRRRRPEHHLQRRRRSSSAEAGMPRGPGGSFFPCCHAKGEPFAEPRRVACAAREIGAVSAG